MNSILAISFYSFFNSLSYQETAVPKDLNRGCLTSQLSKINPNSNLISLCASATQLLHLGSHIIGRMNL